MSSDAESTEQFYLLIYLDVKGLHDRIIDRKSDYIRALTMKRNRAPLKDVFKSKYFNASLENLKKYPSDIIKKLDDFYKLADDLFWYLDNTEDMTQAIKDKVEAYLTHLETVYVPLLDRLESLAGDIDIPGQISFSGPAKEELIQLPGLPE